jgi:hypothetical protein
LREIASHGFSIRPLEMAKLFAKMEFQDVVELGAMQSLIPPRKSEQLLKQLDSSDIRRLEVI